jgi:hypothetical protein
MLVLTADQKVTLSVSYQDRYGNPAPIDGVPVWETSTDGIVTVDPTEDGLSAEIVTVGQIGTVQVRATADALPGAAVKMIVGVLDVQVVGGEARIVTLNAGAASSKDETPDVPPVDDDTPPEPEPAPEPEVPQA